VPSLTPPEPPLSDGVVTLRPFSLADVPSVTEACQDREISRWTAQIPWPYTEEDAIGWISRHPAMWQEGVRAIIDQDAQFLGTIGLGSIDRSALLAGVGYWVAPWARNRGVATRALQLLAIWAFETLGLSTLGLTTMLGNLASERVAVKAGFAMVGVEEGFSPSVAPDKRFDVKHWVRAAPS
jgi:RimJ/RimL family protein N-acetyltransferase